MKARFLWILALATALSACVSWRAPPRFGDMQVVNRPFVFQHGIRLFTVKNGITMVLLPDRRTNLVTVEARYLVGAAEDPAGRAGLAHLVEHLTFAAPTDTERAGLADRLGEATLQYNAATSHDVTHYMATALAHRLPDLIELEAQRLEMDCAQIDDAVFNRERDVVLQELAERRTPWRSLQAEVLRVAWGEHHPYARDLNTLEVADVTKDEACQFFNSHYTPERLLLVVTGDFDVSEVAQAIGKRFAPIQRQGTGVRAAVPAARLTGTESLHRASVKDAMAVIFFPAPAWGSDEAVLHEYALEQLRRVVTQTLRERDWITDVNVTTRGAGQARLIAVMISVNDPKRLKAAVEEVFTRAPKIFSGLNPYATASLLGDLQTSIVTEYESFMTRGWWLADYLTYTRHRGFMAPELEAMAQTALRDLDRYARTRFTPGTSHVALIQPSGEPPSVTPVQVASGREPDLAPWHAPVDALEAQRPLLVPTRRISDTIEQMTLDNGLRVLLAPNPASSLVDVRLVFPYGSIADPPERRGLATAAARLLRYDPGRSLGIHDSIMLNWGAGVGTQVSARVHETSTVFRARGSSNRWDWNVWALAWVLEQFGYLDKTVKSFRDYSVRVSSEDVDPARALTLELLFGAGHPYARTPPTGEQWAWLNAGELERYRQTHFVVPRGATLIVTGGFELEAMRKHVRALFGPWADSPVQAPAPLPAAQPAVGPSWVGTRDPSRAQVGLEVVFATSSDPDRDHAARLVLREMVSDRLRIVREGMGASYGVQVSYSTGSGGGMFSIESELDPVRAAKAATAIISELEALRTGAGAMAEDFVRARRRVLAQVLADAAGVIAVADELENGVRRGLPVGYMDQVALAISQVTPAQVATVAAADLDPRRRVVSVTGTSEQVQALMLTLGATEPKLFDKRYRSAR